MTGLRLTEKRTEDRVTLVEDKEGQLLSDYRGELVEIAERLEKIKEYL